MSRCGTVEEVIGKWWGSNNFFKKGGNERFLKWGHQRRGDCLKRRRLILSMDYDGFFCIRRFMFFHIIFSKFIISFCISFGLSDGSEIYFGHFLMIIFSLFLCLFFFFIKRFFNGFVCTLLPFPFLFQKDFVAILSIFIVFLYYAFFFIFYNIVLSSFLYF